MVLVIAAATSDSHISSPVTPLSFTPAIFVNMYGKNAFVWPHNHRISLI